MPRKDPVVAGRSVVGDILGGSIGHDAGATYRIVVAKYRIANWTKTRGTVGDGDTSPCVVANGFNYSRFTLWGEMVEEEALGLESLGLNGVEGVVIRISSKRQITYSEITMEQVVIEGGTTRAKPGVVLIGRGTRTPAAAFEVEP